MQFEQTPVSGLLVMRTEPHLDERGSFVRTFCQTEIAQAGMDFTVCQTNVSQNNTRGTLRGLHYQAEPKPDPKVVRCIKGSIWDVAIDLRANSATYLKWFGCELSADNNIAMIIPGGCAHGFITLQDHTEVLYLMGEFYDEKLARGVRWNDPAFAINWPEDPQMIGQRDATYPDFTLA
jgi:dTDP-4-dehydrorhamnose 3,5-epimerase